MNGSNLDFASNVSTGRARRYGFGVLVIAAAAVWLWHSGRDQERMTVKQRNAARQADAQDVVAAKAQPASAGPTRDDFVRRATALPWGRLFRAIEGGPDRRVAMLGLEPSADSGVVVAEGEAADAAAMGAYVEHLRASGLANLTLIRHQPASTDGEVERIRFAVRADWLTPPLGSVAEAPASRTPAVASSAAELVTRDDIPSLVAQLLAAARESNLVIRATEHEWSREGGKADFVSVTFETSGDYRAVREFINRAVELRTGFALWRLSLRADTPPPEAPRASATLVGRIGLRIYVSGAS